jgi:hypothetical protein
VTSRVRVLLLLLLCALLFISCVSFFARHIAGCFLPLYRQVLYPLISDIWNIASFQIVHEGREEFISVQAVTQAPLGVASENGKNRTLSYAW